MKKRIVSMLLALIMVFALFPATAMAVATEIKFTKQPTDQVAEKVGDEVTFEAKASYGTQTVRYIWFDPDIIDVEKVTSTLSDGISSIISLNNFADITDFLAGKIDIEDLKKLFEEKDGADEEESKKLNGILGSGETYTCTTTEEMSGKKVQCMAYVLSSASLFSSSSSTLPDLSDLTGLIGKLTGSKFSLLSAIEDTEVSDVAVIRICDEHDWELAEGKEATCTEDGCYPHVECSKCGYARATVLGGEVVKIPAKGHSWDEGTITKEPTVLTAGETTYTCKTCGATKTEEIAKQDFSEYTNKLKTPTITGVVADTDGVTVTWKAISGVSKYRVFYKTVINTGDITNTENLISNFSSLLSDSWVSCGDTTETSYKVTGLKENVLYEFAVCRLDDDGNEGTKATWEIPVMLTGSGSGTGEQTSKVATPAMNNVTIASDGIVVSWSKVDGAAGYCVLYKELLAGTWNTCEMTTATSDKVINLTRGTTYEFNVIAIDSEYNQSAMSTLSKTATFPKEDAKTLDAPEFAYVENANNGIALKWNTITGAAKYRVYYSVAGLNSNWKIMETTNTNLVVTGLTSGTKYRFLVCCLDSNGNEISSKSSLLGESITYKPVNVGAPVLSGISNTSSGVRISWKAVSGATKYRVFYKVDNGSWKAFKDVASNSALVTGLKKGTRYTFTVRCVSDDGLYYISSFDSNGMSLVYTASNTTTLATPVLSSVSNAKGGVTVKWKAVTGAAKYRVFYKTTGSWVSCGDTTATSLTKTGLKSGTKYTFTVRCLNASGDAFTSSYDATGKSITYLATPTLSSVANAAKGVTVKWAAVSGAAKYRVYYKTGSGSWTRVGDTTATSCTVNGLKSGTTYTFTVRAISKDGKTLSSYDATGKSIVFLSVPTLSSAEASKFGYITVKWEKVTGAKGYYIYRKTVGGSWTKIATYTGTTGTPNYRDRNAQSGTTYVYTVRAYNGSTLSSYNATGVRARR